MTKKKLGIPPFFWLRGFNEKKIKAMTSHSSWREIGKGWGGEAGGQAGPNVPADPIDAEVAFIDGARHVTSQSS